MKSARWFSLAPPRSVGLGLLFWFGVVGLVYQIFRAVTSDITWVGPLSTACLLVAISLLARTQEPDADGRLTDEPSEKVRR